jgi:hypothetical protein
MQAKIVGCWELRESTPTVTFGERVQMNFDLTGRLTYGALQHGSWQVMLMSYRVEGAILITDQPTSPREEKTSFALLADQMLQLEFGGSKCVFERIPTLSFELDAQSDPLL